MSDKNIDYSDYEFENDEEVHFEKFARSKFPKEKEHKKSLRDYRPKKDKRNYKDDKKDDKTK